MQKFEEILDSAIARLKDGEQIDTVVSSYPKESQIQLRSLLMLARDFSDIPALPAPQPHRRRLYIEQPRQRNSWISQVAGLFKNAYVVSFLIFLFGLSSTAYATFISLPGDSLFTLKRSVETVRVKLTTNPESRAELQLSLANKRLQEAQQVIYTEQDPEAKSKAIEELNKQTVAALDDIQQIASDPKAATNSKIAEKIKQAEDLAKNQSTLVASIDPQAADQANKALLSKVAAIKSVLATSLEQSSASIPALAKFEKTGTVKSIKDNTLTLDDGSSYDISAISTVQSNIPNQTFAAAAKTLGKPEIAEKAAPDKISVTDLNPGDYVTVSGQAADKTNFATSLTLTEKAKSIDDKASQQDSQQDSDKADAKAEVKGESTKAETKTDPAKPSDPNSVSAPNQSADQPVAKPQDTHSGFILEPVNRPEEPQEEPSPDPGQQINQ